MSCRAKRRRKGKGNYFRIGGGGGGEGMSDSRKEKLGKLTWRSNPSLSVAKRGSLFWEHKNRMEKSEFVLIRYSESPRNQPSK